MRALALSLLLVAGCGDCPDDQPSGSCPVAPRGPVCVYFETACSCSNGEWVCSSALDLASPDLSRSD
jgi:hypothetical protein